MDEEKKLKTAKVIVDRNLCIGAGSCIAAAGDVFELDAENKALIIKKGDEKTQEPTAVGDLASEGISDESLLAAAQSCPTLAIILEAEDGSKIYPKPN